MPRLAHACLFAISCRHAMPTGLAIQAHQPGDILAGRYCLVRLIGEGGMGVVWEGKQITTAKPVAIKILKGSGEGADAARFLREARVAAGLSHRNIVQVFDFWEGEQGGPVFMVMELLVGETMAARLARSGRLTLDEALLLLLPVANGIRAAHAQGVVHRDLKPENIFLARASDSDSVDVKVVDFGLAKPATPDAQTTAVTQTGSVMGTPFYMSPEQVYGEKDIDVRADVWALGVVIYESVSGQMPFTGENFGQIFRCISQGVYTPLREAASHAPPWLDALVLRMLSHDRERRPSITEVCDALSGEPRAEIALPIATRATQRMPSRFPDDPRPPPTPTLIAASTSVRDPTQVSRPAPRGLAFALLGVALAAVIAVGVGATFALRPSSRHAPSGDLSGLPLPPPPAATSTPAALEAQQLPDAAPVVILEKPDAAGLPEPARAAAKVPDHAPPRGGDGVRPRRAAPPAAAPSGDPLGKGRF